MRGIVDFYKRNPFVLVGALVVGLLVSISAASHASDSWIGEVIAVAAVGVLMGLFVAWRRRSRQAPPPAR